jgi:hypothetical protein
MAYSKTHRLAVRTATYESGGETKYRYKDVGVVLTNEHGEEILLLDRTFNPAGALVDRRGSDQISLFRFPIEQSARPVRSYSDTPRSQEELDDIPF